MPTLQSPAGFANRFVTLALCCSLFSMPLRASDNDAPTTTPIKHVVVIFQESLVRSVLRHVSVFGQSPRRKPVPCATRHSDGQRTFNGRSADIQP